jgi:hypothetical protein
MRVVQNVGPSTERVAGIADCRGGPGKWVEPSAWNAWVGWRCSRRNGSIRQPPNQVADSINYAPCLTKRNRVGSVDGDVPDP